MFDAVAAKESGMSRSEAGALPEWSYLMLELVERTARKRRFFTSDDVFDLYYERSGAPTTHDSRAFGPVMMRAAKSGLCRKTDRVVPSRRKSLHASPRSIWESLVC